jgi:hypothetical protein
MKIVLRLSCVLASLALLQACSQANSHTSDTYTAPVEEERPKTAAELRAELLAQEQSDPTTYLVVAGTHRRNFIGQLVLEGYVGSAATLATFKDPVLSVTWYSKTGTEVGTKEYPIYEVVSAKGKAHFKLKTDAPDYVATVALGISGATAVE